eukprot:CAMPEP_0114593800 /NCGR_PEP_ID=MMETSP0125-20121206/15393_1 /TAXON_ID=485358 ORGANISM="Aristerostoma sp., Strain ATCC 50986" /NCGR_SAMPLE_ID=MMETSP0125 /ASSEMBLY_ACC=CAM_ASM_000245 /LENGTH=84 /DNA_ID=CAMNT_0001793339 /DNA_START=35 /DNA_END=289 /DNA_ORIENTATION=+
MGKTADKNTRVTKDHPSDLIVAGKRARVPVTKSIQKVERDAKPKRSRKTKSAKKQGGAKAAKGKAKAKGNKKAGAKKGAKKSKK